MDTCECMDIVCLSINWIELHEKKWNFNLSHVFKINHKSNKKVKLIVKNLEQNLEPPKCFEVTDDA